MTSEEDRARREGQMMARLEALEDAFRLMQQQVRSDRVRVWSTVTGVLGTGSYLFLKSQGIVP